MCSLLRRFSSSAPWTPLLGRGWCWGTFWTEWGDYWELAETWLPPGPEPQSGLENALAGSSTTFSLHSIDSGGHSLWVRTRVLRRFGIWRLQGKTRECGTSVCTMVGMLGAISAMLGPIISADIIVVTLFQELTDTALDAAGADRGRVWMWSECRKQVVCLSGLKDIRKEMNLAINTVALWHGAANSAISWGSMFLYLFIYLILLLCVVSITLYTDCNYSYV